MKTRLIKIAKGDRVQICVRRTKDKTAAHADVCLVGPITVSVIVSKGLCR